MKIGKILIAGIAAAIFNTIVGALTCGGVFNWVYKLEPANVWKPMSGPPGLLFYTGSFVLSLILAFVYALVQKGIPGKNKFIKGLIFGLCVWATGTLPGMFTIHAFMTVATTVVVYWTLLGLFTIPLEGMIIAAIYGK